MNTNFVEKTSIAAQLFSFALIIIGCSILGGGLIIALGLDEVLKDPSAMTSADRWIALASQGFLHIVTFIGSSLVFILLIDKSSSLRDYEPRFSPDIVTVLGLAVIIFFVYEPFIFYVTELNAALDLPDAWASLEDAIKGKEEQIKELVTAMLAFDSVPQFLVGFIVIAVLPAVGEELMFRGVIQPKIGVITGSGHASVWITAIIFSAIHFQFYGFLPRMFIGVLLGYYYLWSGNLLVPMFAHLFNNGFTVVMYYLHQQGATSIDIEQEAAIPMWVAMVSFVLTIGLMYLLHGRLAKRRPEPETHDIEADG